MDIDNQLQLRPRFKKTVAVSISDIKSKITHLNELHKTNFYIKHLDENIWIYISSKNKKFYTPHLHLQLEELSENETKITGLYSPDPGLWTMFMFLHFVVAGIFIIFGTLAYSNWSLNQPFLIPVLIMFLMVIAWFALYFIARNNRKKGMPQARELEGVMSELVRL